MSHITVDRAGKTIHLPLATVQDVIDLMDASYARKRRDLIEDLDALGVSGEDKVKAMSELRERKGMTTDLIRDVFTLAGAQSVIKHCAKPEDLDELLNEAPDQIVQLALEVLGFDVGDTSEESAEDGASPRKGGVTSTTKP
jgi:hypothetical protein